MKLRPAPPPVLQLVPALIAKRGKGGTSFRGADQYDQGKPGAVLLDTNMEGATPRERAREVAQLRAALKLKRAVDHWSISLDPRLGKLTDDQWREVGRNFIEQMGYAGCAYVLTRHVDEPQDHIHATLLRIRADGSTVIDSNDFKRSHEAAARCAAAIGLQPLPPRPDAARLPAPTDSQVGANKRATRRGTKVQNHASIARVFEYIISKSLDLADLESKLLEVDVEIQIVRKSGSQMQGLNVRAAGSDEWLKASGLRSDRSLSWTKVEARLAANLELRERAQAHAEQRVAVRVARRLEPVPQPARALSPEAITQAKEAAMNDTALDFLNVPPPPRPADVPVDDTGPVPSFAALSTEAEVEHKKTLETAREDRERDQAMLDMQAEIRSMSVKALLDLKSNVPPFVLTAAMIERLISLMVRLLTLGLVKRVDNLSDALAARQQLQQLAAVELDRRRRSLATVADRKEALRGYSEEVEWRSRALNKRQSDQSAAAIHRDRAAEAAVLRSQLEAGLDRRQVARGHDTIKTRRAEHQAAMLAHRAARDAHLVPAGFAGLLITKAQRDASVAAKTAATLTLKNAAQRREATRLQLQLLLDEVEAAAIEHERQAAERVAAIKKAEAREADALARELHSLPEQMREVGAAAQRERVGQRAAELVADADRPRTQAELESEEAERLLRQRDLANRG